MKKLLSFVLVLAMLLSMSVVAFAKDTTPKEVTPLVIVTGFGTVPLYDFETDDHANIKDATQVFAPPSSVLTPAILKAVPVVLRTMFDHNWDRFSDKLQPVVMDVFAPVLCDANGDPVRKGVDAREFPLTADHYQDYYMTEVRDEQGFIHMAVDTLGGENTYFFSYDWRLDPMDHAKDLNEYIQNVKKETGSEQVVLAACSMGGTVVMAYFQQFGSEDVKNVFMDNTAFQGISVVGEMFSKDFVVNEECVVEYTLQFMNISDGLKKVLRNYLRRSLLVDFIINFAQKLLDGTKDKVCADILYPSFGQMPGMWAFVSEKDYETAKGMALDPVKNKALIERIDAYHYNVQCKAKEILDEVVAEGTFLSLAANYGKYSIPLTSSSYISDDYLIDTALSAGGAICMDINKTFPEDYKQQVNDGHNHISPDRKIDASTCMFPEYTWFVKDLGHLDFPYGTEAADFLMWLVTWDEQKTVESNPQYPQFLVYSKSAKTLSPLK